MAGATKKPYLKLSVEKRLALIEELWASVQKDLQVEFPTGPASAAERAELDLLIEETNSSTDLVDLDTACEEIQLELESMRRKKAKH